jgi:hypothetical protein
VEFTGKAPLLESNTSLKTAILYPCSDECCAEGDSGECCGTCAKCCGNDDDHHNGCVLLGGLSSATHLKLITESPGQVHLPSKFLIPTLLCLPLSLFSYDHLYMSIDDSTIVYSDVHHWVNFKLFYFILDIGYLNCSEFCQKSD